ncbi:MAG: 6-phosphofructokinase [Thermoguttaceae bacterium]|nr:6-phosphofructokinase [Thermoguttaceae bacterium]
MNNPLATPPKYSTSIKRVAMLFSGGPAPAANSVIGAAAAVFSKNGVEVLGMQNGYTHLEKYDGTPLEEGVAYKKLCWKCMEGVRNSNGILIGTARVNPGKLLKKPEDLRDPEKTAPMKRTYDALCSLGVDALISLGGDDTLTTAAKFKLWQDTLPADAKRIKVVHLPKTIDNDYAGIDFTFGYFSAVEFLAHECYNLLADARATGTYYIAQVMGRAAGWLAYGAAIAGEASFVVSLEDIADDWWYEEETVSPKTGEIVRGEDGKPMMRKVVKLDLLVNRIADQVMAREREGKSYGVIVMAEGIAEFLPLVDIRECVSESEYKKLEPDSFGHFPVSQLKYSTYVGHKVAAIVAAKTGIKKKFVGLQFGYEIRCNKPVAFDVVLGSQLGCGAYRALCEKGVNGVMVSVDERFEVLYRPFEELINFEKLRATPRPIFPGESMHMLARYLETRTDCE